MQFYKIGSLFSILLNAAIIAGLAGPLQAVPENTAASPGRTLAAELEEKGLKLGSPVFIRVHKQSSDLELWVQKGPRYALFKTYQICRWSGVLGPKMREGDRQSPEGLYHIGPADLIVNERWHRAMNINFPNSYDLINGRSGSGILIHGKCASIGCFAIRDENVEEVYALVRAAIDAGQARIPVLALPFRLASAAPKKEDTLAMNEFWVDLRRADILFERDRLPPTALLCDGRYFFVDRRGDWHRHAVHAPGCKSLDKPITAEEAAEVAERNKSILAAELTAAENLKENPKEAVEKVAESCDRSKPQCRLLRVAVKSDVICPRKYPRCRTARAAYSKSADCPLKYPRCRFFVGPDPHLRSASGTNPKSIKR